ncbi:DUF3592 domain-containing protein [Burkholderia glumae]|uniref:DUF3592 domain-containing protein n=2 Tax=Burkholderia glumae TaxID=337 RepID=UPI00039E360B|nr:DUF3592 domain-containing protein [Burkholderia glumae]MCM2490869.1 DUF3592 domain-containing protein [Burkholderia glumae]MCM2541854.1 DUF3592 domain-containing protein [Burkholderia glumae]
MRHPNYLLIAIGLVLALAAASSVYRTAEFSAASAVTTGTVVRLLAGAHHPEIVFEAADGRHYRRAIGTWRSLAAGERVPVRYLADNPDGSVEIDFDADIWSLPVFLCLMAGLFLWNGASGAPPRGRLALARAPGPCA